MTRRGMTATTRTINEMRIDVYARIAEACMVHGLPAPLHVYVGNYALSFVELRTDEDRPQDVDAWAGFLGLASVRNELYDDRTTGRWVSHKATSHDHDGGLWLGFQDISVWCSVKDPEQVARLSALAVLGA